MVPIHGAAGHLGQPNPNPTHGMGTCLEALELPMHPVRISTKCFLHSVTSAILSVFKKQSEKEPVVIVHSFVCLMDF